MKRSVILLAAVLSMSGCAQVRALVSPPERPPPRPSSSTPAPVAPQVGSPATPQPRPSGSAPAPAFPPAPSPPVAPPAGSQPAPAPLTRQMSADQEQQLRDDAQKKLDETDRLLRQIEGRPLKPNDLETFLLAQSFLDQAKKALAAQEYERAANLATKARTLTEDLATATKQPAQPAGQ